MGAPPEESRRATGGGRGALGRGEPVDPAHRRREHARRGLAHGVRATLPCPSGAPAAGRGGGKLTHARPSLSQTRSRKEKEKRQKQGQGRATAAAGCQQATHGGPRKGGKHSATSSKERTLRQPQTPSQEAPRQPPSRPTRTGRPEHTHVTATAHRRPPTKKKISPSHGIFPGAAPPMVAVRSSNSRLPPHVVRHSLWSTMLPSSLRTVPRTTRTRSNSIAERERAFLLYIQLAQEKEEDPLWDSRGRGPIDHQRGKEILRAMGRRRGEPAALRTGHCPREERTVATSTHAPRAWPEIGARGDQHATELPPQHRACARAPRATPLAHARRVVSQGVPPQSSPLPPPFPCVLHSSIDRQGTLSPRSPASMCWRHAPNPCVSRASTFFPERPTVPRAGAAAPLSVAPLSRYAPAPDDRRTRGGGTMA